MKDLSNELKKVIDAHGYGFHYAVINECQRLRQAGLSPWSFEAAEFPVAVAGKDTRIDLILRSNHAVLVGECKRANPALSRWAFVRAPFVARRTKTKDVRLEQFSWNSSAGRLQTWPTELSGVQDQYQVALEMRTPKAGDKEAHGRGAIEDALTQVVRGANGLINAVASNSAIMDSGPMFVVPAIFTTAELWCSDSDLSAANLHTGETSAAVSTQRPWIWFQAHLSASLEHSQQKLYGPGPVRSFAQTLRIRHARSIAIVNATGIKDFLQSLDTDFEDFRRVEVSE